MSSSLLSAHEALGARMTESAGVRVPRGYGDPAAEYAAAREAAAVVDRADFAVLRMWGRDPVKMLQGLITSDLAGAPPGRGVYGAVLTPKGRMLADLRAFTRTTSEGTEILLIVPREALENLREHLKKFVPPMFARWSDVSEEMAVIGVYGPGARELVGRVTGEELEEMPVDGFAEPSFGTEPLLAVRTDETGVEGYDLVVSAGAAPALWDALLAQGTDLGVRPLGHGALHTLRVEAGRPRYGFELTEQTIPAEAYESTGMMERAISFSKGCYTGQEVVVRIAHRGHVNRHLRGLLLGEAPVPGHRTPLFDTGSGKEIGWTTSAAVSPAMGQTIALAYVRREVGPGGRVRVGEDGPEAEVAELPFG